MPITVLCWYWYHNNDPLVAPVIQEWESQSMWSLQTSSCILPLCINHGDIEPGKVATTIKHCNRLIEKCKSCVTVTKCSKTFYSQNARALTGTTPHRWKKAAMPSYDLTFGDSTSKMFLNLIAGMFYSDTPCNLAQHWLSIGICDELQFKLVMCG